MHSLKLEQSVIDKLKAVEVGVKFEIARNLIGFFRPAVTPDDVDQFECPVSEEELLRRAGQGGGRQLPDILNDLRKES